MLASFIGSLLIQAYNVERSMNTKKELKHVKRKKRPYYDAEEVMNNNFSHEGLKPKGYYIEEVPVWGVEDE